ncbi:hypothetical protein NX059_000414 [Plenodomus lindquistii]|nr:hypothetical protein NX059_000414 [Plenodomus lindquistii]
MVVASMKRENTSWLYETEPLSDWVKYIYVVDEPTAELTVVRNKGRFIIDRYEQLPESMVFVHAEQYHWHNDDPDYDGAPILRNLRLSYLQEKGYLNLRCTWTLGCPAEIHPLLEADTATQSQAHAGHYYKQAFMELFPDRDVPEIVGASCCAQFAVSRGQIREHPIEFYQRIQKWLLETPLEDAISGRVLEYSWHSKFRLRSLSSSSPSLHLGPGELIPDLT